MGKKAQGLSINTIIISVIALVVLVVLVAIFTGKLGLFSKGLGEVTTCEQACQARGLTVTETENDENILRGAKDSNGVQCYCS